MGHCHNAAFSAQRCIAFAALLHLVWVLLVPAFAAHKSHRVLKSTSHRIHREGTQFGVLARLIPSLATGDVLTAARARACFDATGDRQEYEKAPPFIQLLTSARHLGR